MQIRNSVFLITGASRGLGLELAYQVAAQGGHPVLVARGPVEFEQGLTLQADVSQDAERIVDTALSRYGRVDVLVNNASDIGPSPMPPLADYSWQALEKVLRTNVLAPLHLAQLVLPGMLQRRQGLIVNITSDAGVQAYAGWGGYGMSKAALEHQSRTLGKELSDTGVGVLLVDPGDMNTVMHRLAEPGVDLSHLPGPDRVAPRLLELIRNAGPRFTRAQAMLEEARHA